MKTYITSDTHYAHKNICGPSLSNWDEGYRDFGSLEEMNDAIVDSINFTVKPEDTLYHLGDWSFGGHQKILEFYDRLYCKNIILIYGNHDKNIRKRSEYRNLFRETHDLLHRKINGKRFVLCHYSMQVWDKSHHGALHCFGHSHHTIGGIGKSMDVGWCGFQRPLDIDEVIEILSKREIAFLDHHNSGTTE